MQTIRTIHKSESAAPAYRNRSSAASAMISTPMGKASSSMSKPGWCQLSVMPLSGFAVPRSIRQPGAAAMKRPKSSEKRLRQFRMMLAWPVTCCAARSTAAVTCSSLQHVHAERHVGPHPLQQPVLDHALRAAHRLVRRLEDEGDTPPDAIAVAHQGLGDAGHDGRVGIVTATVVAVVLTTFRRRTIMAEEFEYISQARLEYRDGYRYAYLGEVPEPVVYGVQGALREYYGAKEGPPIASTLDHIVAAVAG
jgi:hypothetical protein